MPWKSSCGRGGPYVFWATADTTIVLAANSLRQQRRLWTLLERPDLIRNSPSERRARAGPDRTVLAALLLQHDAQIWEQRFMQAGIPAALIRTLAEAMDEDRAHGRDQFQAAPTPIGVRQPMVPARAFRSTNSMARVQTVPRPAGADTDAILRELGYAPAAIAGLRASRVV